MKTIVVVTGPTATGKTALGVALAETFGGEVVSADSMQVYRRMDIGTAKVTAEETHGIPHHMIDVAEPWEDYSVSRYATEAGPCVEDILARGKLPIVVGGTGLYIDALVNGTDFAPKGGGTALREALSREYDDMGGEAMLLKLAAFDPVSASKLHPTDKKRVVRAFEVWESTGKTIAEHDAETKTRPPAYHALKIALTFSDRALLYDRIDRRVDKMTEDGLEREVRGLLDSGVPETCTAMQAIGYKEMAAALRGETTVSEAVDLIKRSSRRYAKRQLSWFSRYPEIRWIKWGNTPDIGAALRVSTDFLRTAGIMVASEQGNAD